MGLFKDTNWLLIFWVFTVAIGEFHYGYSINNVLISSGEVCYRIYGKPPSTNDKDGSKEHKTGGIVYQIAMVMVPVGATVSSFFTGIIADYGRRTGLFIANGILLVGMGIEMINSPIALLIGKLFVGIAVGIFSTIVPIFINEISPTKLKGSYGVASQIAITFGILSCSLIG